MQKYIHLICFICIIAFSSCAAQTAEIVNTNTISFLSYNVENLYDTVDDPKTHDDEFLPSGEKGWNGEKYATKIEHITKVIASASVNLPTFIALVEIENKKVLNDLIDDANLKNGNYNIVHFDSPDERGIDVALLYNKTVFSFIDAKPIRVNIPGKDIDYTRDILYVTGTVIMNSKSEVLHLFINHWPSKAEGEEISTPKRAAAASTLRDAIDKLNKKEPNATIIIMGDFNDTPNEESIANILGAIGLRKTVCSACLVNLMSEKQENNEGSYNFKGDWQALDQFIVSGNLINENELHVNLNSVEFVRKEFMLYNSEKYGPTPSRTYSGSKYYAGYSDHLPIYMEIQY